MFTLFNKITDVRMDYIWGLLLILLNADICSTFLSGVFGGASAKTIKTTTTPALVNSTTNWTPLHTGHYSLNVTCNSSAVLGSSVLFEAELTPIFVNTETLPPKTDSSFIYQWTNTVTRRTAQTIDGLNSSLFVTFSKNVTAGDYLMTVAAFLKDEPTTIVAFDTRKFTLTESLNGLLILTQSLDYQRDPNTFSTKKPVKLTADVHDLFLQNDLSYQYFWFQDDEILANTRQPSYSTIFNTPFNASLASVIMIHTKNKIPNLLSVQNLSSHMPSISQLPVTETSNGSSAESMNLFNRRMIRQDEIGGYKFLVEGTFQQTVAFKDPVSWCVVTRIDGDPQDRSVSLASSVTVNVTCAGSAASSVCVNITDQNTGPPVNDVCTPQIFVQNLSHIVNFKLVSTGWCDVHFFVYNDISRYHLIESFYGYHPGSSSSSSLAIPVVFGILGAIIIVIAGVYFLRLRKQPMVEVADFDFHPSLTDSQNRSRSTYARMSGAVKSVFYRDPDNTRQSRSFFRNSENSSSFNFYESL